MARDLDKPGKGEDKGAKAEELLRSYFSALGYYVVRGIKYSYKGNEVTDIDLWLYLKSTSLSRERVNVDIKNKKTPQAMERVLWTKGVQELFKFDSCIVATTDKRPVIREFGRLHGIDVLDGNFLSKLKTLDYKSSVRYSEEEFLFNVSQDSATIFKNDWVRIIEDSKSRLLSELDYSGCNVWLKEIGYFLDQAQIDPPRRQAACRLAYLLLSYFLIGMDFIMKDLAFLEEAEREKSLLEGFKHGNYGRGGISNVLSSTYTLIEKFLPNGSQLASQLKKNISEAMDLVPAEILKEFFGKPSVIKTLFNSAKKFEELAYKRDFVNPNGLEPELLSIVSVVLDFFEVDRKKFFENFNLKV